VFAGLSHRRLPISQLKSKLQIENQGPCKNFY
jgi:hypothetical protein